MSGHSPWPPRTRTNELFFALGQTLGKAGSTIYTLEWLLAEARWYAETQANQEGGWYADIPPYHVDLLPWEKKLWELIKTKHPDDCDVCRKAGM